MKNVAIIIRGPAGVGKSTVANLLHSKIPNSAKIDVDLIKRMISEDSSVIRTNIAHSVSFSFAKELINNHYNIIIEEVFRDDHYFDVRKVFVESDYKCVTFFLSASLETLIQRDSDRKTKTKGKETISNLNKEILPRKNEIVINTEQLSIEEVVHNIMEEIA
jgi:cytidylate kinase